MSEEGFCMRNKKSFLVSHLMEGYNKRERKPDRKAIVRGEKDMGIKIIREDITKMKTDAVVNAANRQLMAGGGVCGAIFQAAGYDALTKACRAIGGCETGQAVITKGFDLAADYIIHTAGPVWTGGEQNERNLLASCYKNSLKLARENGCRSIAFPLISSGIFGYPREEALEVAIQTMEEFLKENQMEICLVIFDEETLMLAEKKYPSLTGRE